jgi:hypothetical protein
MSLALTSQGRIFAGTMGLAVWRASLSDTSWQRAGIGMPQSRVHGAGLATVPGRPGTLFVGTLGQGVFRTTDAGKHWTNISDGLSPARNATIVLSVAYSPLEDALYAGTTDGIYELSPMGLSPGGPSSDTAHASGLTAIVKLSPNRSGPNQVTVSLRDRQGRPLHQAAVRVLTTHLDMAMGTGLVVLHQTAAGSYTGTGDLGMGGRWRLELLVYRPSGLTRMSVNVRVGQ